MIRFFRNYGLSIIESVATISLTIFTVLLGMWLRQNVTPGPNEEAYRVYLSAIFSAYHDFSTPAPWFIISAVLSLLGKIEGFIKRHRLSETRDENKNLEINLAKEVQAKEETEGRLRNEKQEHSESKSNYLTSLENALKYVLTSYKTGFDHRCRVTVYRLQNNTDRVLRRIFRHSPNHSYDSQGRIRVPVNEGVVGAAWQNYGRKEFLCDSAPDSIEFIEKLRSAIAEEGCGMPDGELSMPSKHFYARSFSDPDSGKKIAIVVYESTVIDALDREEIDRALNAQTLDVSRFIKHLGALHSEFAPDPEDA